MQIFPQNSPDGTKGYVEFTHGVLDASLVVFLKEIGNSLDSFWRSRRRDRNTSLARDAAALVKPLDKSFERLGFRNDMPVGLPKVNDERSLNNFVGLVCSVMDDPYRFLFGK